MTNRQLAERLTEARARTLLLIAAMSDDDLQAQHDPLMGPIIWDLGHIAHFEKLWLLNNLEGEIEFGEMPGMFNPFENPRSRRGELELPARSDVLKLLAETRAEVLAALAQADLQSRNALLRDGYVYNMVLQHEYQHNETMLQTMQLKRGAPYTAPRATAFNPAAHAYDDGATVRFDGGRVLIGTVDRSAAYDNERPQHETELAPFEIDAAPVTNAQYLRFMRDGGYQKRSFWSDAGWVWLQEAGVESPKYWERNDEGWTMREMDRVRDADNDCPVCHVCLHEAEAYARWAGKRLPTEAEWETAATWDAATRTKHLYPWGDEPPTALDANLDQLAFGTSPVGTFARNISPMGCYGMIGDVWEWTSSTFQPHPGFEVFPYPEYSDVFFGTDYVVLRGGSWATRPGAIRGTFRNWDYPIRRQIFSGFRCARDV
ncbi:MAG TPA: ergothioneine biosynthesis protein EgtB [Longimicrobiales bacterium]